MRESRYVRVHAYRLIRVVIFTEFAMMGKRRERVIKAINSLATKQFTDGNYESREG